MILDLPVLVAGAKSFEHGSRLLDLGFEGARSEHRRDPHLADAVLHEPGEGEPVVSEVLRSGYTWNGKVLRPAMVKVRG